MLKGFLTVSSWTMLSRILGLVRDQLLAAFMGAGPIQDAYQIAFRLPNMFRRLFGEGAFNAAFVPLFSSTLEREGKEQAEHFAIQALSLLLFWLTIFCCLGEIFMPGIIRLLAPGFDIHNGRFGFAVSLSRITFPYLILICAAALVSGVLNSLHYFGTAAAAYVSFNIVGILAILFLTPLLGSVSHAAAWGVTASGVVQLAILLIAAHKAGIAFKLVLPRFNSSMRLLLKRMTPGLVGSGITQINLMVDTIIATLLPAGSVSYMYFADRINQLPLGVLGAAAGTTLLPVLTRLLAQNKEADALHTQNQAIEYAMALTLPASIGMIALSLPIIATLFEHGAFSSRDSLYSSQSLCAYALGLPAFVLIKVLSPAFFARNDTVTPVRVGLITLVINFILNLLLMKPLAHIGPPLASSIAALLNTAILMFLLLQRRHFKPTSVLLRHIGFMVGASIMMGFILSFINYMITPLFQTHGLVIHALLLGSLICIGGFFYFCLLQVGGIMNMRYILNRFKKKNQK